MKMLKLRKVIIIGDRDGIPGPAIETCVKSAKAQVVFSTTKCFSCSLAGAMDIELQQVVKDLTSKFGAENLVVVIGGAEAETSGITAETIAAGDPTFVGPLAGIALGLPVYHIFEPEIKEAFIKSVYDEQCSVMEMILDIDEIITEVKSFRDKFCKVSLKQ
ncbi:MULTISPECIES: glycine/sarcosine/betaine reductase complex selenoprotein A [Clostridium]|uniref:Glycine/sarcosine/betaine reductase complex selenoprotein A n=1 Tax=Clostridium frigoriphilum TaxID=443253 RepID=A0ABU7UMJ1_9CLOT|nr:glycine/sarcosine/betaine reductase complex selenoprotein A [Clostridium sp. DSM 17811]MBU3097850.1 glycine/sarcosine/betaine reductase complex selenoprotein A [Clostridium sp. DSM 17811]